MCVRSAVLWLSVSLCHASDDSWASATHNDKWGVPIDFVPDPNSKLSIEEQKLQKIYGDHDNEIGQTYNENEPMPSDQHAELQKQIRALSRYVEGTVVSEEEQDEIRQNTMRDRIAQRLAMGKGLNRFQRAQMRKDGLTMDQIRASMENLSDEDKETLEKLKSDKYMTLQERKELMNAIMKHKAEGESTLSEEEKARFVNKQRPEPFKTRRERSTEWRETQQTMAQIKRKEKNGDRVNAKRDLIFEKLVMGKTLSRLQRAQMRKDGLDSLRFQAGMRNLSGEDKEALDRMKRGESMTEQEKDALMSAIMKYQAEDENTLTQEEKEFLKKKEQEKNRTGMTWAQRIARAKQGKKDPAEEERMQEEFQRQSEVIREIQRKLRREHGIKLREVGSPMSGQTAMKLIAMEKGMKIQDSMRKSEQKKIRIVEDAKSHAKFLQHFDGADWVTDHDASMFEEQDEVPIVKGDFSATLQKMTDIAKDTMDAFNDIGMGQALDLWDVEANKDLDEKMKEADQMPAMTFGEQLERTRKQVEANAERMLVDHIKEHSRTTFDADFDGQGLRRADADRKAIADSQKPRQTAAKLDMSRKAEEWGMSTDIDKVGLVGAVKNLLKSVA